MKSLRAKLFLYVGVVLLIVAALNYVLPQIWIKRELHKVGKIMNEHVDALQNRVRQFTSFFVTYRIVEGAAELDGTSKIIADESILEPSPWLLASRIAAYDPQIAFAQVADQAGNIAVVSPQDTTLYAPRFAPFTQGMLWIEIPEINQRFVAIPNAMQGGKLYFLFDEVAMRAAPSSLGPDIQKKLKIAAAQFDPKAAWPFVDFERKKLSITWDDPIAKVFDTLLWDENQWVEKVDLIKALSSWQGKKNSATPAGLLKVEADFQHGVCVLARQAFSTDKVIEKVALHEDSAVPKIILRCSGAEPDLDMARTFSTSDSKRWIGLGYSISSTLKKIAALVQRTIIVYWDEGVLGIKDDGVEFDIVKESFPLEEMKKAAKGEIITWQGKKFLPYPIDLSVLNLVILIPEDQAMATTWFLENLRDELILKISLSLIVAALFSFVIALILLNDVAKKVTAPIVMLSHAAEELGKGKYENLTLPKLGKQQDEVAVLTHSFEKMVGALIDRDKIRGVLNKVVSKEISEEILKKNIELGGEDRVISMLFSDIRGFTHLSEGMEPKQVVSLLNSYMTHMCRIIDETHGVVDKFVGDEIMALYGAPLAVEDHAVKAIDAALLMLRDLRQWNEEQRKKNAPSVEIGIGIHTGLVCLGNMGAENRLNYTVIGANVNLASRLCSIAKPMQILISQETRSIPAVQAKFRLKELPPATIKGLDHPVTVYEVEGT